MQAVRCRQGFLWTIPRRIKQFLIKRRQSFARTIPPLTARKFGVQVQLARPWFAESQGLLRHNPVAIGVLSRFALQPRFAIHLDAASDSPYKCTPAFTGSALSRTEPFRGATALWRITDSPGIHHYGYANPFPTWLPQLHRLKQAAASQNALRSLSAPPRLLGLPR